MIQPTLYAHLIELFNPHIHEILPSQPISLDHTALERFHARFLIEAFSRTFPVEKEETESIFVRASIDKNLIVSGSLMSSQSLNVQIIIRK